MATPTSSTLTRLRAGAFAFALSSRVSNSGMPEAARVASGARRDRVYADAFGSKLGGKVAHGALERGLGNAHNVVVLHDHLAAVISHRKERAALAHQRFS